MIELSKETLSNMLAETVELAQKLVRAESVSPSDGGTHAMIGEYLSVLNFSIENIDIADTKNIYAKIGSGPYLCFAGHTDIVPPGTGWKHGSPYSGIVEDGYLYGRGANDMKTTIACALVAFKYILQQTPDKSNQSLAMLLTSDEEAIAEHGLKKVTPILKERNEQIKMFVLGEPTAKKQTGDTIKIGRRGSVTAVAKIFGIQGHIAYPELAKNPLPVAAKIASALDELDFQDDDQYFGKTRLQLTNIDSKNMAMNVIPGMAELRFGTRFNTQQTPEAIKEKITKIFQEECVKSGCTYEIEWRINGYPFICTDNALLDAVAAIINPIMQSERNINTTFDAKGATSDGRFLSNLAPTIEIGFEEEMAHKVDERVKIDDIALMLHIYYALFSNMPRA